MGTKPSRGTATRGALLATAVAAVLLVAPQGALAAERCQAPVEGEWQRVTPEQAGMDAGRLQDAIDYASTQGGLAVRVYRYGCLVGEDRFAPGNSSTRFESWSMSKSIVSLLFGKAMSDRLISPGDPVGSLLPEADEAHGRVTMNDLLTMSSGVHWNGFRDYNIFTQSDRVGDWLTLGFDHPPGTYFEYAQSAVAVIPEAIERATGTDAQAYLQGRLLDKLGIEASSWVWERDGKDNIEGFWGARMKIGDFARLGELMRRGGRWRGVRLLSRDYMRQALAPSRANPCYAWLIWTNNAKPCIGPRISDRDVVDAYGYPGTPRDMFVYSGLFGQIVAVFPSQGIVIARNGQDSPGTLAGATNWQIELFRRVLQSITDERVKLPDDPPGETIEQVDGGFQNAIFDPGEYSKGQFPDPLPPAGPARVRAPLLSEGARRIRGRRAFVRVKCPRAQVGAVQTCRGRVSLKGGAARAYEIRQGRGKRLGVRLERRTLRRLERHGKIALTAKARNRDSVGGSASRKKLRWRDAP